MAKKYFKKALSMGLALTLCLSLAAPAFAAEGEPAEDPTLSDGLLQPGKDDIIDKANENAQDLIDGTYDALNPTDPDPDADPTENPTHSVEEIVTKDDEDKDVVKGDVLEDADAAESAAIKTEEDVNKALTVGEGEDAKSVDEAVEAETGKADQALTEAHAAAEAAKKAVEEKDEDALAQAKKDAAEAAKKAEEAYNNAQNIFDGVINDVLKGENGEISEETQAAIDAKAAEILEANGVEAVEEPGEDATDEDKAAYEAYVSAKVNAQNAAKAEVANAKIEAMYEGANEQITSAQAALNTAKIALEAAKTTCDAALKAQKLVADGSKSDIEAYVGFFNGLTADSETAQKVSDAYSDVDSKTSDATTKITDANDSAKNAKHHDNFAETPEERIKNSVSYISNKTIGNLEANERLVAAVNFIKDQNDIIQKNLDEIEVAVKEGKDTTALWENIANAEKAMNTPNAFYYKPDGSYVLEWNQGGVTINGHTAISLVSQRDETANFLSDKRVVEAADQLLADLGATKAAREQLKAEEELKKTLAGLTNLGYEDALKVVKGFESHKDCPELADAAAKLEAQQRAAAAAKDKVDAANAAYEAALAAVQKAITDLTNAELTGKLSAEALQNQKDKLTGALGDLEKAKKDKEDAEDEKKKADDAVIETEQEIGDIIGGDDDVEIDDPAIPLASGPVTRAQFVDYLWRHEGSPAAAAPTFTDVPADHEFAPAIGWAQATGIVSGGTFQPDEIIDGYGVRDILNGFARAIGTNAVAVADLTTLPEDLGEAVLNCDEVLAEFFGEEYTPAEGEDIEIAA